MSDQFIPGGDWIDRAARHVPAVWGDGDNVLWSQGEPLILAGPPGVGKTTLSQQLMLKICGASDLDLLGMMVTPDPDRRVAYIAADRPRQAQRSLRRMVTDPNDRQILQERLLVWEGPLPFSALDDPARLATWLRVHNVGHVIVDSIKDVAGDTADGRVGAAFNLVMQHVVAEGIEFCGLHHPRKAQEGNRKPRKLDDLHGSTWLVAGAGSVIFLHGEAGDPIVELLHLKQPAAEVGPLKVIHDHARGRSTVAEQVTAWDLVQAATDNGVTVHDAAQRIYATAAPNRAQIEKARRKLEENVRNGQAERIESTETTGGKAPSRYRRVNGGDSSRDRSRRDHVTSREPAVAAHAGLTADHAQGSSNAPPLKGARDPDRDHHPDAELEPLVATFSDLRGTAS